MWRDRNIGGWLYCTVVTVGFILVCLGLYFKEIPSSQKDLALVLFGGLLVAFKDVGNFFTGSTNSSQRKDETIAQMATQPSMTATSTPTTSTISTTGVQPVPGDKP